MARRSLAAATIAIALAAPALAAKWVTGCPRARERLSAVGRGYFGPRPYSASRDIEHVGHTLTFRLRDLDVARMGGFSTLPDGNTVEITFTPFGGNPVPLPPFTATATSETTLSFVVPDSRPLIGRLVVGPVSIVVKRDGLILFDAFRQIILPPMNDVAALASQGGEVEVLAAVDAKLKAFWIPLTFGGFGTSLPPECPALMTPIVAFAADANLKKADGGSIPHVSFGFLKKTRLYLGDFILEGINLYGRRISGQKLDLDPLRGRAVALCQLNDTLELVLRVPLQKSVRGPNSEIVPIVSDGSPVALTLSNVSADPDVAPLLAMLTEDSLRNECAPP